MIEVLCFLAFFIGIVITFFSVLEDEFNAYLFGIFLIVVSFVALVEIDKDRENIPQYNESWECVEFNYPEDTRCDFGNGFWNLNYLYAHDSGIELNLTKEQLCENIQGTIDKEKVCTKQIKVRELVQDG